MFSNDLVCDILTYINDNINDKISINDIENNFHYNRYYIMKLFKKEIGLTIINYINSLRIYNSIKCIENSSSSFLSIAINNGFSSLEYFSETFRLVTGYTPSDFKLFFSNTIDDDDYIKIQNIISSLFSINELYLNYLNRRKPVNKPVMKLSLFK